MPFVSIGSQFWHFENGMDFLKTIKLARLDKLRKNSIINVRNNDDIMISPTIIVGIII